MADVAIFVFAAVGFVVLVVLLVLMLRAGRAADDPFAASAGRLLIVADRRPTDADRAAADDDPDPRLLLYLFQHKALPAAAFDNHPELIRQLYPPPGTEPRAEAAAETDEWDRSRTLWHSWAMAEMMVERATGEEPVGLSDDERSAAARRLRATVRITPHRQNGWTLFVITMPPPERTTECHFTAIVHRDGESREHMRPAASTRYFTLERTRPEVSRWPLLCEWHPDGRRTNDDFAVEPTAECFTSAVWLRVMLEEEGEGNE